MRTHLYLTSLVTLLILASCKRDNEIQPSLYTTNDDNLEVTASSATALSAIVIAGKTNTPGLVNGAELKARFNQPMGIFVNTDGSLLIADNGNTAIRKISNTGTVSTVFKSNVLGYYEDLAAISDGTIAILAGEGITYIKNGHVVDELNYHSAHAGISSIDKDPSGKSFWYSDYYEPDEMEPISTLHGTTTTQIIDGQVTNSLSVSLSGNKFVTTGRTIYEVTKGGSVIHLLPNTTFDGLTSIAANKDATKLYLVDGGDIKLVTKCTGCQTHVTKLLGNVKATGVALSNSEKVLFFTSAQNHTISKINLQ